MNINLLIIDDQEFFIKNIKMILKDMNINIFEAQSAQNGINILSKTKIDIILSDVHMPDMDGFQAARVIKSNKSTKDIPIIFITADENNHELNEMALEFGGIDFLHKSKIKNDLKRLVGLYIRFLNREKAMNIEMKKAIKERDKFFSIIAHDLKSPFTGFLGFLEILKADLMKMSIEEIIETVNDVHSSANKLFTLLKNLLEWSRIHRGDVEVDLQRVQLSSIVEAVFSLARLNATTKKVTLKNETFNDLFAFADVNMLQTILRNLIMNAIKFVNEGGKISVACEETDDGYLKIYIEDDGVGISESFQKDLFKLSKNTSTLGTAGEPGTGLGILLCKELVSKQGGEIGVKSELGEGTTFFFTLPKAK